MAAEILAAGEALNETICLHDALKCLSGDKVQLGIVVDSKDLFHSLASQRHPTYRSVRGDVNSIHYYYETYVEIFGRIHGSCNLADVGTKPKSLLAEVFVLTMATRVFHFDLASMEIDYKDLSLEYFPLSKTGEGLCWSAD